MSKPAREVAGESLRLRTSNPAGEPAQFAIGAMEY
jgi:hypothetical protein